jgi:hypothetical protein
LYARVSIIPFVESDIDRITGSSFLDVNGCLSCPMWITVQAYEHESDVHVGKADPYTANNPYPDVPGAFPASRHAQLLGNV